MRASRLMAIVCLSFVWCSSPRADPAPATLSADQRASIADHVRVCWTKDAATSGFDKMRVMLTVTTDPTGVARRVEVAGDDAGRMVDLRFRAFTDRAMRAILDARCAKLPLPANLLGRDNVVAFRFSSPPNNAADRLAPNGDSVDTTLEHLRQILARPQSQTEPMPVFGKVACKNDWKACKDNADLANNFGDYLEVRYKCKEAATKEAKYGTPIWPGFWSGGYFTRFQGGTDYITTGVVLAIEGDAQFQNGFGAMVHSTVYCHYNLETKTVTDVDIVGH